MSTNTLPSPASLGVKFVRPEVSCLLPQYRTIRHCLEGGAAMKKNATLYLPDPSAVNCDPDEKVARYADYVMRAVFYNAARHTMSGLLGQVFSKDPKKTIPPVLEAVDFSASGDGVSLTQLSKAAVKGVIAYSRAGLFVDFPRTDGPTSMSEVGSGTIRPTITLYDAEAITNWQVTDVGAEEVIQFVVLKESQTVAILQPDGNPSPFETQRETWYREIRLTGDPETGAPQVMQQVWKPVGNLPGGGMSTNVDYAVDRTTVAYMRGSGGDPLTRIPFKFLGLNSNGVAVEDPEFYDLCSLNVGHFRNSADFEENVFQHGQTTLFLEGMNEKWWKETLKGKIAMGARSAHPLPKGAKAVLVQAEPNSVIKDAMDQKERQMVALGAKLIQEKDVQRTATEAKIESTSEGSILMSAAKNVSAGIVWALNVCAEFVGLASAGDESSTAIEFQLNTDFDISKMDAAGRSEVVKTWLAGGLAWTEMRNVYRAAGIATLDDEKAKEEISKEDTEDLEFQEKTTTTLAEADPNAGKQSETK